MSSTGEGENANATTVDQLAVAEVVVAEQPSKAVEKPVEEKKEKKEKKTKVPKEKKPKTAKTAAHPPYFQMIKEALLALNEKGGSSPYAIAKYMEEKHKAVLPANFRKILGLQLKNSALKGKLTKVKASYKLSEAGKKEKATAPKKTTEAAKKPTQAKSKSSATVAKKEKAAPKKSDKAVPANKATAVAKTVKKKAKKMTPAKAKQPKSIKSPAAKKAKKAVA